MVADTDFGEITLTLEEHFDSLVFRCEFNGIRYKVADNGLDHIIIGTNGQFLFAWDILQVDFLHLSNHLEDINHTRNNIVQVNILINHIQTTCLTLGPFQQVVQQVVRLLRLSVSLIQQSEDFFTHRFRRNDIHCQIEHHTDGSHWRAEVMGNNGVHLITVGDGTLQFLILLHDDALSGNQTNLVHHTHYQFFLVKGLSQEIVGTNLESMHQIARIIQCRQENDGDIQCLRVFFQNNCSIEATDVRHHHIKQYQIGMLFLSLLNTHISV